MDTLVTMPDRLACERRVYRLAALLTGDPIAATTVIERMVGAQPDVSRLDSAHMDRLTVLRSREIRAAAIVHDLIRPAVADAVAKLTSQQREAWVIGRVYQTPLRELSRAMDCSTTAAERHLLQADAAIRAEAGIESAVAASQYLAASLTMDVPQFYRRKQAARRRVRLTMLWIAAAALAAALGWLTLWWTRPLDGGDQSTAPPTPATQPMPLVP